MKQHFLFPGLCRQLTLVLLLAALFLKPGLFAQTTATSSPGAITFQRKYTLAPQEYAYAVSQSRDSGFVVAGQLVNTTAPFAFDVYLEKTDKYGNISWSKTVGPSGFVIDRSFDVHQVNDGGYICSGITSGNMYIFKLNAAGNLSWSKSAGDFFGVPSNESDAYVVQTADGGYMFAASTDSTNAASGYLLLTIVKVDSLGVIQWEKSYDSFVGTTQQAASSIIRTSDGNYMIAGTSVTGSGNQQALLFKIDPNGDTLWTKIYDVGPGASKIMVKEAPAGGYIVGGCITSGSFLLRVDAFGNTQWEKQYSKSGNNLAGYFIDAVSDGGYMIGGYTGASSQWNYYMIKTNATGDTLWTKRYAQNANMPGVAWAGQETNDRGFIIAGNCGVIGDPTNTDIYLVKTDSLGNSGCYEQPWPVNVISFSPVTSVTPYHKYLTNISQNPATALTSYSPVTVLQCCHVPLSITGMDTVCTGSTVTLTAAGGYSYQWSTGATTASITVTANSDTSFSVTGFSGPTFSCESLSFNITTATVNPAIAGNDSICSGSSTTLTASGGNAYSWSTGAQTSSVTVNPASTTTYTVAVSIGSCTVNDSFTVVINPSPVAAIGMVDTICSGQSALLIASGGGTYQWSTGDTTAQISVSPASTSTYTVVVSNGMCTDSATVVVNVNATPVALISGNANLCSGDSTVLTASGGGSYQWSTGGNSASVTVTPLSTTTYSVIVTNSGGCADTATQTVTVNPLPNAIITGNSSVCSGSSVTLTAGGGNTFSWSNGGTTQSITVSPASATTYSVTVSNGNCSDTTSFTVSVNALPNVTAVAANDTISIGGNTTLSAAGGTSFSWSPSTGLSCTTCQNPLADPLQSTTYCVTATDANGCSNTACVTVFVNNDCGELFVPNAFSPNNDGENDQLCIYGKQCIATFDFAIYDRWGEKVFATNDPNICWDGTYHGQMLDNAVFVYYLNATLVNGQAVTKKGNIALIR